MCFSQLLIFYSTMAVTDFVTVLSISSANTGMLYWTTDVFKPV